MDGVKNAINVITPEEAKVFQCISASTKNEWIDKFEMALKFNQLKSKKSQDRSKKPTPKKQPSDANMKQSMTQNSLVSQTTITSTSTTGEAEVVNTRLAPEWMTNVQEEIHTLIAQRHFEDALTLITKCEEYFARDNAFQNANEMIQKVKMK